MAKQNFYNGQSPFIVPTNQDFLDRTHGWMDEEFISYKGWKISAIDMPQYASDENKFTMFYAVNSSAVQHFYFASALLSDGYFFYAPTSTQWFAEYGAYTGGPTGQAYQLQGFPGVWARDYTVAKVIVNPTSAAVTVNMPGYVDSSGNPASSITIHPNDGAILKSSAGTWGSWTNLGENILNGTSPAVCSPASGQTDWFVVGTNHQLYYTSNGGSSWTSLGGNLTSSPAAVSPSAGVIDVFVRGTNGALYTKHYSGGAWGAWTNLGGQLPAGTSPAASSWGASREDVFVRGTNGALYQNTWTGASWSGWTSLGGSITSSPAATSPASGVIDVGVRGTNGALYTKHYSGGTWGAWTNLGGQLPAGTSPAASSWGASREDVFVQGTNGALYQNTWTGSAWSGWTSLGGSITSSPAATSPASGVIDVGVRGTNGAL